MAQVVVDSREPAAIVRHLEGLGVVVKTRRIWAGDYEVGERAIVERKTVRGLHFALFDGQLWPQVGRIRRVARFSYLLIEGETLDDGPLAPAAIRGVCVTLMDLGVQIIRSSDLLDSARWLQRLAERRARSGFRSDPHYAHRPRTPDISAARCALAAVPGISHVTADALLLRFGTLANVVNAQPAEWQRVRGIGPRRSKAMEHTFHTAATASGSRLRREPQGPST